jgi:DNA repair exonuclease SbcCD nuclease subunit
VPGNHDPHAYLSVAGPIAAYFDSDPRVEVDLSPSKHWFYRFGNVLIGATHGDTAKVDKLLGVMAVDRATDWGQTLHRYWYLGHVHHQSVHELAGVTCESFRTLAAKDAYAHSYGYRAGRDMRLIVHHREHGEIERHRCDVGMLETAT